MLAESHSYFTKAAVAAADAERLLIPNRSLQRIAHDGQRHVAAISEHPQAGGLARSVVTHDHVIPVGPLDRFPGEHLDRADHPAIHQVDLELPFRPDEFEAAPIPDGLDF
jgi:hypothetical protein